MKHFEKSEHFSLTKCATELQTVHSSTGILISFLLPNPLNLIDQNASKDFRQTYYSLKRLNSLFHKELAVGHSKNRCITDSKLYKHIKQILWEMAVLGLWIYNKSFLLILRGTTISTKDFTLEGALDFQINLPRGEWVKKWKSDLQQHLWKGQDSKSVRI